MQHGFQVRVSLPHFAHRSLIGRPQHTAKPILVVVCIDGNRGQFRLGFLGARLENENYLGTKALYVGKTTERIKG